MYVYKWSAPRVKSVSKQKCIRTSYKNMYKEKRRRASTIQANYLAASFALHNGAKYFLWNFQLLILLFWFVFVSEDIRLLVRFLKFATKSLFTPKCYGHLVFLWSLPKILTSHQYLEDFRQFGFWKEPKVSFEDAKIIFSL